MPEQDECQHLNKTWHKVAGIYYWRCPDCQQEHYCESFGAVLSSWGAGGDIRVSDNGGRAMVDGMVKADDWNRSLSVDGFLTIKNTAQCIVCQREESLMGLLNVRNGDRTESLCYNCQAQIVLLGVDLLRERLANGS